MVRVYCGRFVYLLYHCQLKRSLLLCGIAVDWAQSLLMAEPAKKKRRSGVSGWAKYNQKRAETGIRKDDYRGLANGARHIHSIVVGSSSESLGSTDVVSMGGHVASCSDVVQIEVLSASRLLQNQSFCVSRESKQSVSIGTQTEPAAWSLCVQAKPTRDMGVGEHLSGEPFLWRGIFDMP